MNQHELWQWMMDGNYPETYPDGIEHRTAIATLARPVELKKWQGHGAKPEFKSVHLPSGTKVKVVMASRFGDVGITDNLNAENGYDARIDVEPDAVETLVNIEKQPKKS